MAHKFKVGDRVVVSHAIVNSPKRFRVGLNGAMKKRAGEVVTITKDTLMYDNDTPVYRVKEDGWAWSEDMLMCLEGD